ncbi:MAG: hypothetical protein DMD66_03710 [Gemmatimonadetes bacterium]|nr:MAG: hypothetical protein DMD66_03710 [Gemmatimonadota bacterium]
MLLAGLSLPAVARAGVPDWILRYEWSVNNRIPSFSRQTGLACNVCHTAFPMLTAFGRQFKLNAYTLTGLQTIGPTEPTLDDGADIVHTDREGAAWHAGRQRRVSAAAEHLLRRSDLATDRHVHPDHL